VVWQAAPLMVAGSIVVRRFVIVVAVTMTAYFFLRAFVK
jgi:hypothetical protein